jgi:hypothetical protein
MSADRAAMHAVQHEINRHYIIHGYGGITAVQACLAQHGLCSLTTWEPGPPSWRFHYDTYLSYAELQQVLRDLIVRYDVKFAESK